MEEKNPFDKVSLNPKEFNDDDAKLERANIIVAGITGTGKSTLINAVFGFEDSKGAKTGIGRPITDHIDEYMDEEIPIRIWDTVGLELDSAKTEVSIEDIKQKIADQAHVENRLDVIHAIWYCINSGSRRYQETEMRFIKDLYSTGVPFIIVLTQCIDAPEEIDAFEAEIKAENAKNGMEKIHVVQILAKEYRTRLGAIEAFGLKELVNVTLDQLPEYVKNGFAAAQKVDKSIKRARSEEIICEYVQKAKNGFWDRVPLINLISANKKVIEMIGKIGKLYNLILDDDQLARLQNSSIDLTNAFHGLLNPFEQKYGKKVQRLLTEKKNAGFEVNIDFDQRDRVARLVAYYGYCCLDTLELLWDDYLNKGLEWLESHGMTTFDEFRRILNHKLSGNTTGGKSNDTKRN